LEQVVKPIQEQENITQIRILHLWKTDVRLVNSHNQTTSPIYSVYHDICYTTDFSQRWHSIRFYVKPTSPTPPNILGVSHSERPRQPLLALLPTEALR
jgi:hypothetical protein